MMVVILTPVDGIIRWLPRGFSCSQCAPRPDSEALMNAVDRINRAGKGRIFFAGQGINVGFAMRREMLSPEYTTDWNALPRAFMR
ncbi:TPA: DUF4113 domain-containing protein [Klebsiella pneumoniae]|nr:DUF4113 domain-containing protein [Klebsiella pneumoniae]HCM5954723.1 DUF4113 domain-containing protein [Klebsiella pneumoniae]